jgi:transcriptional regulator with XRE-family HTH domain
MITFMDGHRVRTVLQVGGAVRQARLDAGLTQAQLAVMAGVSRRWIIMLERGENRGAEFTKVTRTLAELGKSLMVVEAPQGSSQPPVPSWITGGIGYGN